MKKATHIAISLFFLLLLTQSCAGTATDTSQLNLIEIKPLIGSWKRTEGGYVLTIKEIESKVGISYLNPSQGDINVSSSKISKDGNLTKIDVTLHDMNKGYSGGHYALIYDEKSDTLKGSYKYTRGMQQVTFYRVKSIGSQKKENVGQLDEFTLTGFIAPTEIRVNQWFSSTIYYKSTLQPEEVKKTIQYFNWTIEGVGRNKSMSRSQRNNSSFNVNTDSIEIQTWLGKESPSSTITIYIEYGNTEPFKRTNEMVSNSINVVK